MPTELESTSSGGKDIFDAIKDSLNYVEANKESPQEIQTPQLDSSTQTSSSFPYVDNEDDDDEDEEEISIFDYFLNSDKTLSSTTPEPIGFNVTGKPLANGATNSPMHIEPVIPLEMKNESVKFAMLPMSLYNMINDDGTILFEKSTSTENEKMTQTTERAAIKAETTSTTKQPKRETTTTTTTTTTVSPTTATKALTTTTTSRKPETSVASSSTPSRDSSTANRVSSVVHPSTVETIRIKSTASTKIIQTTTHKPPVSTSKPVSTVKTTKSSAKTPSTTSLPTSTTKRPTQAPTTQSTSLKTTPTISTTVLPKLVTKKKSSVKNSTSVHQVLTTKAPRITSTTPKIIPIPLNSNPSNVESDINYDYNDPTLPPSLPNLKIIPFLPTDAVRNSIHKSEDYNNDHGYYVPSNGHQHIPIGLHAETNYSPFNVKPDSEHLPYYNAGVADDRVDYDSYKQPPPEIITNVDYGGIYSGSHQPGSIDVSVNSKLDYENGPPKKPAMISTGNKNLTVKPPLPPFEPEHLYNLPPQIQLQPDNAYVQYHVNGGDESNGSPVYHSEHNYQIPQFVTIPPIKQPARPSAGQSAFSSKNKFSPPVQTEGEKATQIR